MFKIEFGFQFPFTIIQLFKRCFVTELNGKSSSFHTINVIHPGISFRISDRSPKYV